MRARATAALGFFSTAMLLCQCGSVGQAGGPDGGNAGQDGGGGGGLALGFFPSNVSCALTGSVLAAASADAGVDLSKLADVDIMSTPQFELASDNGSLEGIASSGVVYTVLRQSNGIKIGVFIANSWTIESGATLTLSGAYPIALVAVKDIIVYGGIDATIGNTPPGGFPAPAPTFSQGGGPGGGAAGSGNGSSVYGAGGGSYCGTGGVGSMSTAVTAAYGTSTIIPLVGGSSGGNADYNGATGGGAVELVSGTSIKVNGLINVGGLGAGNGGGGGSGGALLLEAPTVAVTGTLAANGGGGASGPGTGGKAGQPSATPAQGASTSSGNAGDGSGGAVINGGTATYGSGGGAAGRIRINTQSGAATLSGVLSPAASTACVTQGTISLAAPTCN